MRALLRLVLPLLGLGLGCAQRSAPWPAAAPPIAGGPIVLITLESLRADFVGGFGAAPGFTPNLDRLIPEARASGGWAAGAISPSAWTAPVLASLLTGLGSWQHGVLHAGRSRLGTEVPTLAEQLGSHGWRTQAFAPGRRVGPKGGLGRGFGASSPLRDKGRRVAVEYLEKLPAGRELVWIHLSQPESPFERNRGGNPAAEAARSDYGEYVRRQDSQLEALLSALRASGRWDEALVAVVACQGQDLGDPGPRGVGGHLERSLIEVPLVVKLPAGGRRPVNASAQARVGTVQLYATLLEAAGVTPSPAVAPSLFLGAPPPVLSELYVAGGVNQFSLVDGELQWIRRVTLSDPTATTSSTAEILRRFQETLPLSGQGEVEGRLLHWLPASGTDPFRDPAAEVRLGTLLERAWFAFVERERAPSAERWSARTR